MNQINVTAKTKTGLTYDVQINLEHQMKVTINGHYATLDGSLQNVCITRETAEKLGLTLPPQYKEAKIGIVEKVWPLMQARKLEAIRKSPITLHYYNGDYYRPCGFWCNGVQMDISDYYQNPMLKKLLSWDANNEKAEKAIDRFFWHNKPETLSDLSVKYGDYNGQHISEVIFPSLSVLESYLLLAFEKEIKHMEKHDADMEALKKLAAETGKPQLISSGYIEHRESKNCESTMTITHKFMMPDGTIKTTATEAY